jgi:predicted Zn-dependent peptidase
MIAMEADRIQGLAFVPEVFESERGVIASERRLGVDNDNDALLAETVRATAIMAHPYHWDVIGWMSDILSWKRDDIMAYYKTFYAPNNAVLAVTGDYDPVRTKAWIQKYFSDIPSAKLPPAPDLKEPRQEKEKRAGRKDPLAARPALGIAYHVPERNTPQWYAFGLIDQVIAQGSDALLYDELVRKQGLTGEITAGINWGLGNMFDYAGPMLWMAQIFHDTATPSTKLVSAIDGVVERLRTAPLDEATLERARVKMRSDLYANLETFAGFGRANLLASFALFDDDPKRINQLEAEFAKVTPALLQETAREYLRPGNRTVYTIEPGKAETPGKDQDR